MIQNFEKETAPLTDEEKDILVLVVKGLKHRVGAHNAITNVAIRKKLYAKYGIEVSDVRMRKIVNHIRLKDLVPNLCASSRGYYVAATEQENYEYLQGLQSRIQSIQAVLDAGKVSYQAKWKHKFI